MLVFRLKFVCTRCKLNLAATVIGNLLNIELNTNAMNKIYSILISFFLLIGCNNNATQKEKEYIKNLEEKNKVLEKELDEIKTHSKQDSKTQSNFFTIGSSEDEVISIMGNPSSYMITAPEAKKFEYGFSTVYFYKGKVISYDNLDENLKVKLLK